MVKQVIVLGGGSAGLIAALTLRRRLPQIAVTVVRSPDIGIIGVGEGTTVGFPKVMFRELRMNPGAFYAQAQPTWKLGIRFLWGPRPQFFYAFSDQFNLRWDDLPKRNGFYASESVDNLDVWSALMLRGKAFPRRPDGLPDFAQHRHVAFHVENQQLVAYLETQCHALGATIVDGTVRGVERGGQGIEALVLESGKRLRADFFIDASGFRSELLGRALEEPFESYDHTLFCDRAVIGGWPRTSEPILPYTTCETMDAGWCWQIEHEGWINRGYVYSSRFLSDDAALAELMRKNPQIANVPRVVKFRTGRYRRTWVGNVFAVGNASGFVEPLEATAISAILTQCRTLADCLFEGSLELTPGMADMCNRFLGSSWDEIRDFIALHYKFNTRLDTPFWQMCHAETTLGSAQPLVDFYQENGPTPLSETVMLRPSSNFGMEGYFAMLVGQQVPHRARYQPPAADLARWERHRQECAAIAERGVSVREALDFVRRPDVTWS